MKNTVQTFILFLLCGLVTTSCVSADKLAHRVLFPFDKVNERLAEVEVNPPANAKIHTFADGSKAWHNIKPDADRVLLYLHGNGESAYDLKQIGLLQAFDKLNLSWVTIDYPGLGLAKDVLPINQATIVKHASQALELAQQLSPLNSKVYVIGRSLGAAVASQIVVSSKVMVNGLVLISPWTSLKDMVREQSWLGRFVSEDFYEAQSFKTIEACKHFPADTLIIHGAADKLIPADMGKKIAKCGPTSKLILIEGLGHNDLYTTKTTFNSMITFIRK